LVEVDDDPDITIRLFEEQSRRKGAAAKWAAIIAARMDY
jgi:hypothetical protein